MVQGSASGRSVIVPLSNRRGTSSVSEGAALGVDKLSVSWAVPPGGFDPSPEVWSKLSEVAPGKGQTGTVTRQLSAEVAPGVRAFVGVSTVKETGASRGKVEFNPSRVLDPDGWSLAPVEAVGSALVKVLGVASDMVSIPSDPAFVRLKRVDVARDFSEVESAPELIRGLGPIPRPWARRNNVHADPAAHGAQTLFVGSGAGGVRLYDKHAETVGAAPPGSLRWEVEARSAWLSNYGQMGCLKDLCSESLALLVSSRWPWSQMGADVVSGFGAVLLKVKRSGLSEREQDKLIAYLVRQAAGEGWSSAGSATLAKYRKVQRELGIVVDRESISAGSVTRRLDFESGREVVRVA